MTINLEFNLIDVLVIRDSLNHSITELENFFGDNLHEYPSANEEYKRLKRIISYIEDEFEKA